MPTRSMMSHKIAFFPYHKQETLTVIEKFKNINKDTMLSVYEMSGSERKERIVEY